MSETAANIRREEADDEGVWRVTLDGHDALMTYSRVGPGRVIIDHTEVPDALGGRGVGKALLTRAVADARVEGFKIVPSCPFVKAQIERHPEWHDVLQEA